MGNRHRVKGTQSGSPRAFCVALLAVLSTSCALYHPVGANFQQLRATGFGGVRIEFAESPHRELGRIRATERSWLFADCDAVGQRALEKLATYASLRGANLVSGLRFRGRWKWLQEPVCRQNFTWGVLVAPLFLPIPLSVTVTGYAGVAPAPELSAR